MVTPQFSKTYDEAIGLKAWISERPITIQGFDNTPPQMDTPDRQYLGLSWWRGIQEPGFSILRFQLELGPAVFTKVEPVRVSYRQPLLNADGNRRFFYAPILNNLPTGVASTDTNFYAITLEATPECELEVTYCEQHFSVARGGSRTLAPKHFQPIRVLVKPCSNAQGAANGTQPFR